MTAVVAVAAVPLAAAALCCGKEKKAEEKAEKLEKFQTDDVSAHVTKRNQMDEERGREGE